MAEDWQSFARGGRSVQQKGTKNPASLTHLWCQISAIPSVRITAGRFAWRDNNGTDLAVWLSRQTARWIQPKITSHRHQALYWCVTAHGRVRPSYLTGSLCFSHNRTTIIERLYYDKATPQFLAKSKTKVQWCSSYEAKQWKNEPRLAVPIVT